MSTGRIENPVGNHGCNKDLGPARPSAQPPAIALQSRGAIEVERDDDVVAQHRDLDLAPETAERERDHGLAQLGGAADVAAPLLEGHRDFEPSALAHDAPHAGRSFGRVARGASVERHAGTGQEAGLQGWSLRCDSTAPRQRPDLALIVGAWQATR